jgi:hypothetical protein
MIRRADLSLTRNFHGFRLILASISKTKEFRRSRDSLKGSERALLGPPTGRNSVTDHENGEIGMSADWYFLKNGFFNRRKRIGPICENELLLRIEKGELNPETMMSSTSKTHGHWLPMREIKPAIKHWKKTHPGAA